MLSTNACEKITAILKIVRNFKKLEKKKKERIWIFINDQMNLYSVYIQLEKYNVANLCQYKSHPFTIYQTHTKWANLNCWIINTIFLVKQRVKRMKTSLTKLKTTRVQFCSFVSETMSVVKNAQHWCCN